MVVAKRRVYVKVCRPGNTDLELVLGARVGDYFPVVNAAVETVVGDDRSETVTRLKEIGASEVCREFYFS